MVKSMAIALKRERGERTNKEGRAASLRDIRRCQGLAEGWPWQPLKDPLHYNRLGTELDAYRE